MIQEYSKFRLHVDYVFRQSGQPGYVNAVTAVGFAFDYFLKIMLPFSVLDIEVRTQESGPVGQLVIMG